MADERAFTDSNRWPLRGFWLVWYGISWFISVVFILALPTVAILTSLWAPLLALPVPVIGVVIGGQLLGVATTVTVGPDGTLTMRRAKGTLRTHALRVRCVRWSAFVSKPNTPIVIETDDGSTTLVRRRDEVHKIIATIRTHNRGLKVDL